MNNHIEIEAIHHLTLTVSDVGRFREFYTSLFGFEVAGEFGPRVVLSKGSMLLALGPAPDPSRAISGDAFDENRVGLDHLSFTVTSQEELEQAVAYWTKRGCPTGRSLTWHPSKSRC